MKLLTLKQSKNRSKLRTNLSVSLVVSSPKYAKAFATVELSTCGQCIFVLVIQLIKLHIQKGIYGSKQTESEVCLEPQNPGHTVAMSIIPPDWFFVVKCASFYSNFNTAVWYVNVVDFKTKNTHKRNYEPYFPFYILLGGKISS